MTEFENQTLPLLREIRAAISETKQELLEIRQELHEFREQTNAHFDKLEKGMDWFRVRQSVMDTRQNDLAGNLAAIARVVARAKEFEDDRPQK